MGLFGGLFGGGGGGNFFDRLGSASAGAQAALAGDYGSLSAMQAQRARQRAAEEEAREAQRQRALMQEAAAQMGIPKAAINSMRDEELSRLIFERQQPRQFGPEGGSVMTPGEPGTAPQFQAAPWQRQVGRTIVGQQPGGPVQNVYEGVEPVSVQPGGGLYGVTGSGQVSNLIDPAGAPPPPQQGPPAGGPTPGTVINGYRFRGGNPNDPNAWEPVGQGGAGPSGPRNFR